MNIDGDGVAPIFTRGLPAYHNAEALQHPGGGVQPDHAIVRVVLMAFKIVECLGHEKKKIEGMLSAAGRRFCRSRMEQHRINIKAVNGVRCHITSLAAFP